LHRFDPPMAPTELFDEQTTRLFLIPRMNRAGFSGVLIA